MGNPPSPSAQATQDNQTAQDLIGHMDRMYDPRLSVSLGEIDDRDLFPGEPITVSWDILDYAALRFVPLENISIFVDIERIRVYTHTPPGPPPQEILLLLTPEQQRVVYPVAPPRRMTLRITAQGGNLPRPIMSEISFGIQRESAAGAFWTWIDRRRLLWEAPAWKTSYVLRGSVRNPSQFLGMHAELTLNEAEAPGNSDSYYYADPPPPPAAIYGPTTALETLHGDIPTSRAQETDFTFRPITQSWPWLAAHTWVVTGPTEKPFRYTVEARLRDDFENEYGTSSIPLEFVVRVSNEKQVAAQLALLSLAGAAVLAVAAIWFPPAALASGALQVAAESAGQTALDPPDPDSKYDELAPLPVFTPPDEKDPKAQALDALLYTINWLLTSRQTLFIVEGKMMGAQQDKNAEALELQTKHYQELVRQMWDVTRDLTRLTKKTVEEITEVTADLDILPKLQAWGQYGISNEDWNTLTAAGLSPTSLTNMERALKEAQVRQSLAAPSVMIARIASATLRLMREVVGTTFAGVRPQ